MTTQQDKDQVAAVIKEWAAALSTGDVPRVKAVWDSSYLDLIYLAEENNDPALGWSGIENYYNALVTDVGSSSWSIDNLKVDVIGDAAWAYVTYLTQAEIVPFNRTMTFDGRSTFILRKTGDGWKIIHYHESLSRDRSHETWDWFFEK